MSLFSSVTDFFTDDYTNLLYLTPLAPFYGGYKAAATGAMLFKGGYDLFNAAQNMTMMPQMPITSSPQPSADPDVKAQSKSLDNLGHGGMRIDVPRTPGVGMGAARGSGMNV